MNTRLTITLEQTVIDAAKNYAKNNDRTVSDLVGNYLKLLTEETQNDGIELTPTVRMLKGAFYAPRNFNEEKKLDDKLTNKYLKQQ